MRERRGRCKYAQGVVTVSLGTICVRTRHDLRADGGCAGGRRCRCAWETVCVRARGGVCAHKGGVRPGVRARKVPFLQFTCAGV